MAILLLSQGEPEAREILRQALQARYGISPPAIEYLEMRFKGRIRAKFGPIATWVPLDIEAHFSFPNAMRWDFSVKPVGVTVQRGIEAFDGQTYRRKRGDGPIETTTDEKLLHAMQHRLWAIAAVLLSPLTEHFVHVTQHSENVFEAKNTQLNTAVALHLRPDKRLDSVSTRCFNAETGKVQTFTLRLSEEQTPVNGIMFPKTISAYWDQEVNFEAEVTEIINALSMDDGLFSLQADAPR